MMLKSRRLSDEVTTSVRFSSTVGSSCSLLTALSSLVNSCADIVVVFPYLPMTSTLRGASLVYKTVSFSLTSL